MVNEVINDYNLPLDLERTERVELDDETLPYAEEDCNDPEQTEVDKGIEPDFPLTKETRHSQKRRNNKKHNPYGNDFIVDRITLNSIKDSVVGQDEIMVSQDIELLVIDKETGSAKWSSNRKWNNCMNKN